MGSRDCDNVWSENSDDNAESSTSFNRLFSDKTATVFNNTVLVVYSVHAILSNVSNRTGQCLINNGHNLLGFLSVSCTQEKLKEEESV